MPPDDTQRLQVLWTYLLTRKCGWLLIIMILIGVVVAGWGWFAAPTPSAVDTGGTTVQFWRLLAVGSASLPVLTLSSPIKELEEAAGPAFYRLRAVVLGGTFVVSSTLILAAAAVGVDPTVTPLIARALLAWFGVALISGRVLGWNYSWILPWAALCALLYWGHRSQQDFYWWEVTAQPATHPPSMLLGLGLFAAGIAAYSLSPWRIRQLTRSRHRTTARAGELGQELYECDARDLPAPPLPGRRPG